MPDAVLDKIPTIEADMAQTKAKLDKEEDVKILDWLTRIDYGPKQSDHFRRRQLGTGQWLLDTEEFQGWLSNNNQTLFCPGIPGAGKTILTSTVVNYLSLRFHNNLKTGIVYIYCESGRQNEQKIDDLLASILKQLTQCLSHLPDVIEKLYSTHTAPRTRPSLEDISEALQAVITMYLRVFVVVDGLDECQTFEGCRARLLSELFKLQTKHGINIFATSRMIPEIVDLFKTKVSLEIRASDLDVARYLESRIEQLPVVSQLDRQLQKEIKMVISEAVDGMYILSK